MFTMPTIHSDTPSVKTDAAPKAVMADPREALAPAGSAFEQVSTMLWQWGRDAGCGGSRGDQWPGAL